MRSKIKSQGSAPLFSIYCGLILSICMMPFVYYIDAQTYRNVVREDHWAEYATALALMFGGFIILYRLFINWKAIRFQVKLGFVMMALTMFVGFGEEISWGQRIFKLQSPDFFTDYNLQNETNIHNLKILGIKLNQWVFTYGMLVVFIIYFSLPYWINKQRFVRKMIDRYGLYIPKRSHSLVFLLATLLIHFYPVPKVSELWELSFAITMLMVIIQARNQDQTNTH